MGNGAPDHGFSRARFTHHAQDAPGREPEGNVAQGRDQGAVYVRSDSKITGFEYVHDLPAELC
jgi:hypothetical protein